MLSKKLRLIVVLPLLLLLLVAACALLLDSLIQRPSVQRFFLNELSSATGYELQTGEISVSFWGGVGISARDLKARSKTGGESIAASRIKVTLDAGELIRGRIVPTRVYLFEPNIELPAKKGGRSSRRIDLRALKETLVEKMANLASISLEGARISTKDFPFELDNFNFDVFQHAGAPQKLGFSLRGDVGFKKKKSQFILTGTINLDVKNGTIPSLEMTLRAATVPLTWIPWPESLPVLAGHAEVKIKLKAERDVSVSVGGNIVLKDVHYQIVDPDLTKDFYSPSLAVDFESRYADNTLQIPTLRVSSKDFLLEAVSSLDFQDTLNPGLDLEVKSHLMPVRAFKGMFPSPLLPSWIENRLFPVVTDGEVRVDHFSLKGTLHQIENLDLKENAHVLAGQMVLKDLTVLKGAGGLPFEGVSGKLSVNNGALVVSGVKGGFGRSILKDGILDIKDLYPDDITYDISIEGSFDLEDLLQQREVDLIPIGVRRKLNSLEDLSGSLEARVNFRFEEGWHYPRIRNGTFRFKDCKVRQMVLLFPIILHEAELKVDGKGVSSFRAKGLWGNSTFKIKGSGDDSLQQGRALVDVWADMNEILDHYNQRRRFPVKFSDLVTCRFHLSRNSNIWSLQGTADLEGIVMETESFSMDPPGTGDKIIFSLNLTPEKEVKLLNLFCDLGDSSLGLSGSFNLKDRDSYNLRVSTEGLSLEDLGARLKKTNSRAKGMIVGKIDVRGLLSSPLKTSIHGGVKANDLSFTLGSLPSPVHNCRLELDLSGKKISIVDMIMAVGKSPISVTGELEGWDGLKGDLKVRSDYLDLSDFIKKGKDNDSKEEGSGPGRFAKQSDIGLVIKAPKGRWRGLSFHDLNANCLYKSGDFHVGFSEVLLEHGVLILKGDFKEGKEPIRRYSVYVNLDRQPTGKLLESVGFDKTYIDGSLTMEGNFTMEGRKKHELISSLNGKSDLLMQKGTIRKSGTIIKVLDFLSLQKIFAKKPPDISKKGFYFEEISADITLTNGKLKTNNLKMNSPVFNAAAKGWANFATKQVDFDLAAQPLETIDWMVSKIPLLGYILAGKDRKMLIYYFKVNGPMFDPKVKYVPLKDLGNSVTGFFKRIFLTPGRLLKKIPLKKKIPAKGRVPQPEDAS